MKLSKIISVFSAAAIAAMSMLGGFTLSVGAAEKTTDIVELINSKKVKTFGRYIIEDNKMVTNWSAAGFEINVKVKADTTMRVNCETYNPIYLAAFVDGEQLDRESAISGTISDLYVDLKKGTHTVRVVRDTPYSGKDTDYFAFKSIVLDGEILDAPEDSDLYIEVIGDSIACGSGVLGVYTKGKAWKSPEDHSGVKGFGYQVAKMLDADYSLICRGGIGLLPNSEDAQEDLTPDTKYTMQDIYNYIGGIKDAAAKTNEYDFAKKPDLILLELGANDSATREEEWKGLVVAFIKQLREKNGPDVPIVWVGKNETHFSTMNILLGGELSSDKNLYALQYPYGGSGSAAKSTQAHGHPNSLEQKMLAEKIVKFLKEKGIVNVSEQKQEKVKDTAIAEKEDKKESGINVKTIAVICGSAAAVVAAVAAVAGAVSSKKKKKKGE